MKKILKQILNQLGLELRRRQDAQLPFLHQLSADGIERNFWIANSQTRDWWGTAVLDFNCEFRELQRLCTPGATVVEVGSHHGMMTLLLSQCVGEAGLVHAIEASADNAIVLDANLFQNRTTNVSTSFCAIGKQNGVVNFGGESLAAASGTCRSVPIYTLDTFCAKRNINALDLVKIDVEGFEYDVLLGGQETLRTLRPKIALELHVDLLVTCGQSAAKVWELLGALGLLHDRPITMLARPHWDIITPISEFSELPKIGVVNLFIG